MTNNKLKDTLYVIGMILVMIIATMNVLNYAVPKMVSYLIFPVAILYFFLLFTNNYKK